MRLFRSSRWRQALVAACLPYLLLSLFVDFVHLHPLLSGDVPQIVVVHNHHFTTENPASSRNQESQCAICQWLKAGTGLQAEAVTGPAVALVCTAVAVAPDAPRGSPHRHPIDPRGPPSVRSL